MMSPLPLVRHTVCAVACLVTSGAWGGYYPMYSSWPQSGGPGTALTLTYSYDNVLDGSIASSAGIALPVDALKGAFERAFQDYADILPIHFVEVADIGPAPDTGQYDPTGLPQIRIGHVPHVEGANAYAYFPSATLTNGLAGDIVFNAQRFGFGWSPTLFYGVAQHELGHSLGMGHWVDTDPLAIDPSAQSSYNGPLFPLDTGMISALQGVYGVGSGSVVPMTAVPEPSAWAMLLVGIALVGVGRRNRS